MGENVRATGTLPPACALRPLGAVPPADAPTSPESVDFAGATWTSSTLAVERGARRAMLHQIASLERELVEQRCSSWPRAIAQSRSAWPPAAVDGGSAPMRRRPTRAAPRLLSLEELELVRDELVEDLSTERKAHAERTFLEEERRRLREELILDPAAHAGAAVTNADVGESGCGAVRSEPAAGLLGMLMGWWRVVVSSGCP